MQCCLHSANRRSCLDGRAASAACAAPSLERLSAPWGVLTPDVRAAAAAAKFTALWEKSTLLSGRNVLLLLLGAYCFFLEGTPEGRKWEISPVSSSGQAEPSPSRTAAVAERSCRWAALPLPVRWCRGRERGPAARRLPSRTWSVAARPRPSGCGGQRRSAPAAVRRLPSAAGAASALSERGSKVAAQPRRLRVEPRGEGGSGAGRGFLCFRPPLGGRSCLFLGNSHLAREGDGLSRTGTAASKAAKEAQVSWPLCSELSGSGDEATRLGQRPSERAAAEAGGSACCGRRPRGGERGRDGCPVPTG